VIPALRAVYSAYPNGGKRAGQVKRLHIVRETSTPSLSAGRSTLCGQGAYPVTNSDRVIITPLPARPPEGLSWCPKCVGHAAELFGLLDEIGAWLAAYGPVLTARGAG
jgi:hypothetical protein